MASADAAFLELKNFSLGEEESMAELEVRGCGDVRVVVYQLIGITRFLQAVLASATALRDATNHMMGNLPAHLPGADKAAKAPSAA